MTDTRQGGIDWTNWLARWDAQQTGYLPAREERFNVMFDALEILLPPSFVAVDLACGPGSLSQRLLRRFPQARSVAVDLDPVLLAMGQGALGDVGGRLRWVEADLASVDWAERLGETEVDAVLSTTALHWLPAPYLVQVYQALGTLVRPGGLFLDGDHLGYGPELPTFARFGYEVRQREERTAFSQAGSEDWEAWWDALGREPAAAALLTERARRFAAQPWHDGDHPPRPIYDLHVVALHDAGFREVGTIWQHGYNRVLMAVR